MDNTIVNGIRLGDIKAGPLPEIIPICRKAAADGCVLLKNEGDVLPLKKGQRVAFFGRTQNHYLKSGTGSGGGVIVPYISDPIEELKASGMVTLDETLLGIYSAWVADHPFDKGHGWATEPWCQVEMPLDDEVVASAAERCDVAVIMIGRLAGEDKDNGRQKGSYLLNDDELDMIKKVTAKFSKVVAVLNVGNIIDTAWVEEYNVNSLLYIWQGGQEGGNAMADILLGRVNPSGKLFDTVAKEITDYPSDKNFGDSKLNVYEEDIYVGYRYFETVAPDRVVYPFGFGLSYTTFETKTLSVTDAGGKITITAEVKNTGSVAGREVVEVYYGAPQGKLGRPLKELCAFKKTKQLEAGESETLTLSFDIDDMSAYDDSGVTGNPYCYVLEEGDYKVYVGTDVRSAKCEFTYTINEQVVTRELSQACAPIVPFKRMHPVADGDGFKMIYEDVPLRKVDIYERMAANRPADIEHTGDKGYKLEDVRVGNCTMEQFIAQLSDYDMCCMVRGEGMCSYKAAGTGSAFAGITESLQRFGIPAIGTSDGPSGLRMPGRILCSLMPNGACLASTWDTDLCEELYSYEGMEMYGYKVDTLLGPGMNVHRHPLNGRNFEYFSEDPLLSGKLAAAMCRGLAKCHVTATIKHMFANSQETGRHTSSSDISERAIREIYLRGFEIAVKEGGASAVMTSYNAVNRCWTAGYYDLNTTILRGEWGFDGMVMTDWWTHFNEEGEPETMTDLARMIRSQNDVFMVCASAEANHQRDNLAEGLESGLVTRGELQRSVANILRYAMQRPGYYRYAQSGFKPLVVDFDSLEPFFCTEEVESRKKFKVYLPKDGIVSVKLTVRSDRSPAAQMPIEVHIGDLMSTVLATGTDGKSLEFTSIIVSGVGEREVDFGFDSDALTLEKAVLSM